MTKPGIPGRAALAVASMLAALTAAIAPGEADGPVGPGIARALARTASPPLGLPPVPGVAPDARRAARIALGRRLFFDARLSRNGDLSCAGCHDPARAFAGAPAAVSTGRRPPPRRDIPTLLNAAYATSLFRDGRAGSLEEQVAGPLFARAEMANASAAALVARLAGLEAYRAPFRDAFGGGATLARIARAIAAYERTLVSGNSPFDRWFFGGEAEALGAQAKRGFVLFVGRAGCVACHRIGENHALFTDNEFHFIGTGYRTAVERVGQSDPAGYIRVSGAVAPGSPTTGRIDLGRQEVTGDPADQWRYRTPSLRNVALTAPYMHDGSFATLAEVVRYYNYVDVRHPRLDERIRPLALSRVEMAALVAFLESLTGDNVGELAAAGR